MGHGIHPEADHDAVEGQVRVRGAGETGEDGPCPFEPRIDMSDSRLRFLLLGKVASFILEAFFFANPGWKNQGNQRGLGKRRLSCEDLSKTRDDNRTLFQWQ